MDVPGTDIDSTVSLEQNRLLLLHLYRDKLRTYETRYELPSERVLDEIKAGRLRETAEVCNWLMVFRAHQMA